MYVYERVRVRLLTIVHVRLCSFMNGCVCSCSFMNVFVYVPMPVYEHVRLLVSLREHILIV